MTKLIDQKSYHLNSDCQFECQQDVVVISQKQNHPSQRFLRWLGFAIPKVSYLSLDRPASLLFLRLVTGEPFSFECLPAIWPEVEGSSAYLLERGQWYLDLFLVKKYLVISE